MNFGKKEKNKFEKTERKPILSSWFLIKPKKRKRLVSKIAYILRFFVSLKKIDFIKKKFGYRKKNFFHLKLVLLFENFYLLIKKLKFQNQKLKFF